MKLLKSRRLMLMLISFALIFAFGVMTSVAQEKWKVINYGSNLQSIPVPDEEGHTVAAFERRGSAIFEDGELAAWLAIGIFDWTKMQGPGWGYHQYTFKDGSTIWAKAQFTSRIPPGEKLNFIEAKGEFIKGTGRFEGIKGSWTCKGPFITPMTPDKTKGDLIFECIGTRILPRK
jgi:hypothetical protein